MANLYVFLDESGNYDFSPTGTEYLVYTSLITADVTPGVLELYQLRHRVIDEGTDIEYFHAAEDRQAVRDEVFKVLAGLRNCRVDSVVVEKRKAAPSIRQLEGFYPLMVGNLLKYPFDPRGIDVSQYGKVFVFLDRAGSGSRQQEALIKGVQHFLARHFRGVPYVICMHQAKSHPYLQMVDYASWAVYVKWEKEERRPYAAIAHLVKSAFPVFSHGFKDWY